MVIALRRHVVGINSIVLTTASRRYLRSAARGDLEVLATKTVTFGSRSFASSAPQTLEQPITVTPRSTLTLRQFSSRLKIV